MFGNLQLDSELAVTFSLRSKQRLSSYTNHF